MQNLTSEQKRQKLFEIIRDKGIVFREVKLSNGSISKYYYDIKLVVNDPEGVALIGELMFNKIYNMKGNGESKIKSVGGLEIGAIPIATAILSFSALLRAEHALSGFFVRKNPKTHGLEKKVEGKPETPLVVVDDVITTGQSVMDALAALNSQNITPSGIISVIDRENDRNILKQGLISYVSLFKHSEFEEYIESKLENLA
jgi:orotate phosphoribosyltransferase